MKFVTLFVFVLTFSLVGCTVKENYSVQYGFSNEIATETSFNVSEGELTITVPFADFSCDQKSFKATLSRNSQILTMRLKGTETSERCSTKFSANVSGLPKGRYQFDLVYEHGDKVEQVVSRDFSIE